MTDNSRQALVGAIGGTYISLATMDIDELTVENFALLNSASFKSPMEAIERYLKSIPRCPRMVALSIAGKVEGDTATMTNLPWTFDWNDIRSVTDADKLCFVNEFDALALAMPHMTKYELIPLGNGVVAPGGYKAVIAAGTGLGTANLFLVEGHWHARSGASRLASLPIGRADEFDFSGFVDEQGFVPAGRLLCGKGLLDVYRKLGGAAAKPTPESITTNGLKGTDDVASRALELMATWLGRFAGDIALHYGAIGGLYLAGGLPTGLAEVLKKGSFRAAFDGVGDRAAYLKDVAVYALKPAADPGLRGAAVALANSLPKPNRTYQHRLRA
jgi:glucokinase